MDQGRGVASNPAIALYERVRVNGPCREPMRRFYDPSDRTAVRSDQSGDCAVFLQRRRPGSANDLRRLRPPGPSRPVARRMRITSGGLSIVARLYRYPQAETASPMSELARMCGMVLRRRHLPTLLNWPPRPRDVPVVG